MKEFFGKLLCKLHRHDWEEVLGEWEEHTPWSKSYTNAQCQRCEVRTYFNWGSGELGKILKKLEDSL